MRWRYAIHHPRADRCQRLSGIRGLRADEGGFACLRTRKISLVFRLKIFGRRGASPAGWTYTVASVAFCCTTELLPPARRPRLPPPKVAKQTRACSNEF